MDIPGFSRSRQRRSSSVDHVATFSTDLTIVFDEAVLRQLVWIMRIFHHVLCTGYPTIATWLL